MKQFDWVFPYGGLPAEGPLCAVLPAMGGVNTKILSVCHGGHKADGDATINLGVYSLHITSLHFIGRGLNQRQPIINYHTSSTARDTDKTEKLTQLTRG